jgi:hypothetical protein
MPQTYSTTTTTFARRKVCLVVLMLLNALIFLSVYFAYNGLPNVVALPYFQVLSNPSTPFSEYLRLSTPAQAASTPWTPLSLSRCEFGMPSYYAPCIAQTLPNVAYAEELLYPDFEIREPYFAKEQHRQRWRRASIDIKDRAVLDDSGWMAYKGQSGQNFVRSFPVGPVRSPNNIQVFNNVKYTWSSSNFDTWSPESCMSKLVSTSPIKPITDNSEPSSRFPLVTIALSPDSHSFQHHLDRVTHIIAQGSHLLHGMASDPYVVTGRRGSKTVRRLWELLGYDRDHVLNKQEGVEADTLVFSCRAVLIHPWLSLKSLESFGIKHDRVSTTRKKVRI